MAINNSNQWISLDAAGTPFVHDTASHPDATTIIAVPGGQVPADAVQKYNLGDLIKAPDSDAVVFDAAGNAIYHDANGVAHSVELLPKDDPRRAKGMLAEKEARAKAETDAAKPKPKPGVRHIHKPTVAGGLDGPPATGAIPTGSAVPATTTTAATAAPATAKPAATAATTVPAAPASTTTATIPPKV